MSDLAVAVGRKLSRSEQLFDDLLSHYMEVRETLRSSMSSGEFGDGDLILTMSDAWNRSYVELERALVEMRMKPWKGSVRVSWGQLYWHLAEWYLRHPPDVFERTKKVPRGGKWIKVPDGREYREQHGGADPFVVLLGLRVLRRLFRGEPFVPLHKTSRGQGCGKPLFGEGSCRCNMSQVAV